MDELRPCGNENCQSTLKPEQTAYCSNTCRLAGMRARKAQKLAQPDVYEDERHWQPVVEFDPQNPPPVTVYDLKPLIERMTDWRRPAVLGEALDYLRASTAEERAEVRASALDRAARAQFAEPARDWRRPAESTEAMQSWHRRGPR